ncbi:MAG: hypothetical protein WEA04_03640 [Candidatus Andersenbacteria bacterium]
MPDIVVEKVGEEPLEYRVMLREDEEVVGEYGVSVSEDEYERYGGDVEPHELVQATFTFLLAREEPEAIAAQFSLSEVEKHFPEYPDDVQDYF